MDMDRDSNQQNEYVFDDKLKWTSNLTLKEAWLQASSFLRTKPISQDPHRVAEWLLLDLIGYDRSEWILRWDEPFPRERWEEWLHKLKRKADGEPVQYITGEQEFMGYRFEVAPGVLIPRPETEILVETALEWGDRLAAAGCVPLNENETVCLPTVADIGTGSGAIAISLALLRPSWILIAIDLSEQALDIAQRNAKQHRVIDRITFLKGDLMRPLVERKLSVDMLLSNPPYIPSADLEQLPVEVKDYEPHLALYGGKDGLECYRRMLTQIRTFEKIPRVVGLECGDRQAADVANMLELSGLWRQVQIVKDLAGKDRHVFATSLAVDAV